MVRAGHHAARGDVGTRGVRFFSREILRNVRIRRRGAATTKGQKFDFNRDFRCFIADD